MASVQWFFEMDEALRDGVARGFHMRRIAEEVGVAEGTARKRAKFLGLETKKRAAAKPKDAAPRVLFEDRFAELLADGVPASKAGDMLGIASGNSMLQRIRSKIGWQAV